MQFLKDSVQTVEALNFRLKTKKKLYYLRSENNSTDQRLCFAYAKIQLSHDEAHLG